MGIRILDIFDPGSGIRDGKIQIRDPAKTSRIRNTDEKLSDNYSKFKNSSANRYE
jgi:hypothetical protein